MYRDVTLDDYADIELMLLDMQSESSFYSDFKPSRDYFLSVMALIHDNNYYARVAEIDGIIQGVMLGILQQVPFIEAKAASEVVIYVRPEKRGSSIGYGLIKDFERFAIDNNADFVFLGVSSDINSDKVGKFYNKIGYSDKGQNYMKGLN